MDLKITLKELYEGYKTWVCNNPNLVTDMETVATWSSYFIAGKINKSPIVSELVYSLSKLLCLFNDRLIRETYCNDNDLCTLKEKIKLLLTVVHYCEVFVELVMRRQWGLKGKWTAAVVLQIAKCSSALVLLYKFKEMPISHPPIPILQRKKVIESMNVDVNCNKGFVLKRSKRIVRRVEGAPPIAFRDWQPVQNNVNDHHIKENTKDLVYAETIQIMKPLLHLAAMGAYGTKLWKQWLISLGLELYSLKLYGKHKLELTSDQKLELSRRRLTLLLYLLRSPVYNRYTEKFIERFLKCTAEKVPLTSFLCSPVLQYLNHWQDIYFYMWAS